MAAPSPPLLVVTFCYNERIKIASTLERFCGHPQWDVWVMDDGSTDGSTDTLEQTHGVRIIRHDRNRGAGAAVRTVFEEFVRSPYQVVVLVAGNDKDRPEDVMRAATPVLTGERDVVQGSRYLPGGEIANIPVYRQLATRYVHPMIFNVVSGLRMTDTTNGFRAIHRRVLEDPRLDLSSPRLDQYDLEPFFLLKTARLGYRLAEVPVRKIYPRGNLSYTKMAPVTGWWSILRPLIYCGLGIWK
ncbi:MAG TPA: glycosyltransferase family 2 protein [Candidatus Binatia bacterium]